MPETADSPGHRHPQYRVASQVCPGEFFVRGDSGGENSPRQTLRENEAEMPARAGTPDRQIPAKLMPERIGEILPRINHGNSVAC